LGLWCEKEWTRFKGLWNNLVEQQNGENEDGQKGLSAALRNGEGAIGLQGYREE